MKNINIEDTSGAATTLNAPNKTWQTGQNGKHMKNALFILVGLAVIGGASYFATGFNSKEIETPKYATFSKSALGIEFDYRAGSAGYVIEEKMPTDTKTDLNGTLILSRAQDKLAEVPVGGEGQPVISISVFNNKEGLGPQTWADTHVQNSNIELKTTNIEETSVGGSKAIRYMTDGLYASEMVVVANSGSIYIINGQFMDEGSAIRHDLGLLIDSVRFIPKPVQK